MLYIPVLEFACFKVLIKILECFILQIFYPLGMAIQNNLQNSQQPMAAIPQHLNPTDVANPSAVLLSPPVRKTRIQQPKPETG